MRLERRERCGCAARQKTGCRQAQIFFEVEFRVRPSRRPISIRAFLSRKRSLAMDKIKSHRERDRLSERCRSSGEFLHSSRFICLVAPLRAWDARAPVSVSAAGASSQHHPAPATSTSRRAKNNFAQNAPSPRFRRPPKGAIVVGLAYGRLKNG